MGWASSCKLKGCWFESPQGTCLGYMTGPQLGACKRQPIDVSLTQQCFTPSLSPSLPLSLKINKYNVFKKSDSKLRSRGYASCSSGFLLICSFLFVCFSFLFVFITFSAHLFLALGYVLRILVHVGRLTFKDNYL